MLFRIKDKYIESGGIYLSDIDEINNAFVDYDELPLSFENKKNIYVISLKEKRTCKVSLKGMFSDIMATRRKVLIKDRIGWIIEDALEFCGDTNEE